MKTPNALKNPRRIAIRTYRRVFPKPRRTAPKRQPMPDAPEAAARTVINSLVFRYSRKWEWDAQGRFLDALVAADRLGICSNEALGREVVSRLIKNSDLDGDGRVGWGLRYAWDAFSRGTKLPAGTVYTVTTVNVIRGLWHFGLHYNSQESSDTASRALDDLLVTVGHGSDGEAWYFAGGEGYDVPNVGAYAASAIRMLGRHTSLGEQFISRIVQTQDERGNWPYAVIRGEPSETRNDLFHWAMIAVGLLEWGENEAAERAYRGMVDRYLNEDWSPIDSDSASFGGSSAWWGPGELTRFLVRLRPGDKRITNLLASEGPTFEPRGDTYLALGLLEFVKSLRFSNT